MSLFEDKYVLDILPNISAQCIVKCEDVEYYLKRWRYVFRSSVMEYNLCYFVCQQKKYTISCGIFHIITLRRRNLK
jgi:hypothetical protein